jgi:hypothetical protein
MQLPLRPQVELLCAINDEHAHTLGPSSFAGLASVHNRLPAAEIAHKYCAGAGQEASCAACSADSPGALAAAARHMPQRPPWTGQAPEADAKIGAWCRCCWASCYSSATMGQGRSTSWSSTAAAAAHACAAPPHAHHAACNAGRGIMSWGAWRPISGDFHVVCPAQIRVPMAGAGCEAAQRDSRQHPCSAPQE